MKNENNKTELLAPAGTIEAGITALNYGADAVYTGLSRFNARERGKNLSIKDVSKLIEYAHGKNKKVYITLNTLIKESELEDVADLLAQLAVIRPDAVIVQDIGVARLVREYFPVIPIHGSTQMGIHNSAGIEFAKSLGISRVILERQVTFEEIRHMQSKSDMELEMFIHGALCCSRSGACLFSSWHGGWSGNRGKCKQPCRRRYFAEQGNGFFFSPGDLSSIDQIKELKKMGLSSLKIEGRLRKFDYVKAVVSAYRMALDAEDGDHAKLEEAKNTLKGAIGRKWLPPFSTEKQFSNTIQNKTIGASGQQCGIVLETMPGRFLMETSKRIFIYDTIRVQPKSGDEGPAITITKMQPGGESRKSSNTMWIYCDKRVEKGSIVFKTGHAGGGMEDAVNELPEATTKIDFHINVSLDGIEITTPMVPEFKWEVAANIMEAEKRPLDADKLIEQFSKSNSTKFSSGNITTTIVGNLFVPAGELKNQRRDFWDYVGSEIKALDISNYWLKKAETAKEKIRSFKSKLPSDPQVTVLTNGENSSPHKDAIICKSIFDTYSSRNEILIPDFCGEFELPKLEQAISGAINEGCKQFRVTSIFGLELLKQYDNINITTSYMLPACNSFAVAELKEHNAQKIQAWIELEKESLDALIEKCGEDLEIFVFGRLKLLSTRLKVPAPNEFSDSRGANFYVDRHDELTDLYSTRLYNLDGYIQCNCFYDLSQTEYSLKGFSNMFNHDRDFT
ncbi:MAG: U32 family peptidase [Kiritimatiellae bacterium]|jgi:putative protease|nr:U32 family peptidase [Kiritimatiellia bacterium]